MNFYILIFSLIFSLPIWGMNYYSDHSLFDLSFLTEEAFSNRYELFSDPLNKKSNLKLLQNITYLTQFKKWYYAQFYFSKDYNLSAYLKPELEVPIFDL